MKPNYASWWCYAVFLGIVANCVLSVPGIFYPNVVLSAFGMTNVWGQPVVWTAAASMLLTLLSIFYIPAALNPYRYTATAWTALLSRASGATFFLLYWPHEYPLIGYLDLTFLIVETPLLILALRNRP
jgi:hypothetical protein